MSPIRVSERDRYPDDWPAISNRIRFGRAGGRCECTGQCGRGHEGRCVAVHGQPIPTAGDVGGEQLLLELEVDAAPAARLVVLTCAHLDHTPENSDDSNLLAACQACHLALDQRQHAANAAATRAAARTAGMKPLFATDNTPGGGGC